MAIAEWFEFQVPGKVICAEHCAATQDISRAQQDEYALESQRRAGAAWSSCRLSEEVVPVEVKAGKKTVRVEKDDHLRPDTTLFRSTGPATSA